MQPSVAGTVADPALFRGRVPGGGADAAAATLAAASSPTAAAAAAEGRGPLARPLSAFSTGHVLGDEHDHGEANSQRAAAEEQDADEEEQEDHAAGGAGAAAGSGGGGVLGGSRVLRSALRARGPGGAMRAVVDIAAAAAWGGGAGVSDAGSAAEYKSDFNKTHVSIRSDLSTTTTRGNNHTNLQLRGGYAADMSLLDEAATEAGFAFGASAAAAAPVLYELVWTLKGRVNPEEDEEDRKPAAAAAAGPQNKTSPAVAASSPSSSSSSFSPSFSSLLPVQAQAPFTEADVRAAGDLLHASKDFKQDELTQVRGR